MRLAPQVGVGVAGEKLGQSRVELRVQLRVVLEHEHREPLVGNAPPELQVGQREAGGTPGGASTFAKLHTNQRVLTKARS